MAKNRLGVGFIGAGFVANFHIRSWVGVRDADINGIISASTEESQAAAAVVKKLRVGEPKVFSSITDMVADPNIDALWICAPNYTRLEVMEEITDAVKTGKGELIGVACEKPLGRNAQEARKMFELVQKAELLDGYLENQVFSPTVVRGKNIIWIPKQRASGILPDQFRWNSRAFAYQHEMRRLHETVCEVIPLHAIIGFHNFDAGQFHGSHHFVLHAPGEVGLAGPNQMDAQRLFSISGNDIFLIILLNESACRIVFLHQ